MMDGLLSLCLDKIAYDNLQTECGFQSGTHRLFFLLSTMPCPLEEGEEGVSGLLAIELNSTCCPKLTLQLEVQSSSCTGPEAIVVQ